MNKKIIYPQETGIAIITPSGDLSVEDTAKKDVPNGLKYKIIDDNDLPKDRTFRKAWEFDFTKDSKSRRIIKINLDKAKDITKERLRQERKPLLETQDILFMQAQESGGDTKEIIEEKQRLRDITQKVDSCTTTEELKTLSCAK